eukprot:768731-Hanusia_phi.AAC.1
MLETDKGVSNTVYSVQAHEASGIGKLLLLLPLSSHSFHLLSPPPPLLPPLPSLRAQQCTTAVPSLTLPASRSRSKFSCSL